MAIGEFKDVKASFLKVFRMLEKNEQYGLILATFIMLITGILTNLPAVILGRFVDGIIVIENPEFDMAIPFLVMIVVVVVLREILNVIRKYVVENIATQIEKKQTVNVVGHMLKIDISLLRSKYQIGALHGRIFRSISGLVRLIKLAFLDFFPTFFSAFAAIAIAFYQMPWLASMMILVVPSGLFIVVRQISSQKGIRVELLRGKEKIDGKVVEMMGGLETIRVDDTGDYELDRVGGIAETLRRIEIKHHVWMALYDALKYLNEAFFYVLVVSLSVYFAVNGVISKGDILTYSILFMSVIGPLREMHRILDEAHESSILVNDLDDLIREPVDESFDVDSDAVGDGGADGIVFDHVSFNYDGQSCPVLDDVSFRLRKGEKIGIVGASGCGKSTLVKIILRLVHGYDGHITVLGEDLKHMPRGKIAQYMAYVPQNTYIFSGTVEENIAYGCRKELGRDDIISAAKKASIYDDIIGKLGGFDGIVTENGNNLSGGQRQRIAIARLILQSPEILIFDEATSALDNTNESVVLRNMEEMFSGKMLIVIAHRLTTLKNMDRIYVFDMGKIVQVGNYDELSKVDGLFRKFIEMSNSKLQKA